MGREPGDLPAHRAPPRGDPIARVVVHNHPYHATLLATLGRLPEITHQAACMFDAGLRLVDEYQGQVLDADAGTGSPTRWATPSA